MFIGTKTSLSFNVRIISICEFTFSNKSAIIVDLSVSDVSGFTATEEVTGVDEGVDSVVKGVVVTGVVVTGVVVTGVVVTGVVVTGVVETGFPEASFSKPSKRILFL
jgi:hypothetical protein